MANTTSDELKIRLSYLTEGTRVITPEVTKLHILPVEHEGDAKPFTAADAENLAKVPGIERITQISFVYPGADLYTPVTVTPDAWAILAEKFPNLTSIDMSSGSLSPDSARALAASSLAERMTNLKFDFAQLEPAAVDALLDAAEAHPKAFGLLNQVNLQSLPFSGEQAKRFGGILARSSDTMHRINVTPSSNAATDGIINGMLDEGHAWQKLEILRLAKVDTLESVTKLFSSGTQLPALEELHLAAPAAEEKAYQAVFANASLGKLHHLTIQVPDHESNDSIFAAARLAKTKGGLPDLEKANNRSATLIGPSGGVSRGGPPRPPGATPRGAIHQEED